ncbi:MAG: FAD-binding oxidoreductase [Calditrichaeota bacterium]|nr:FAD-binding oxidoreductase [Calditrichota bacterium]MCB9391485.1 FAD-binding oxidoreductase [Calditrichota bacterium]
MLFDRYAKLKKQAPGAVVLSRQKEMLPLLSGAIRKEDLPELIVDPGSVEDLEAVLRFASDKSMPVSVVSGQHPSAVQSLEGAMLLLTHRLIGPSQVSADGKGVWAYSGTPLEALVAELAGRGLYWPPLLPIEPGETLGTRMASGIEGYRCVRSGGLLSNLRTTEWVGYDGTRHVTGIGLDAEAVDVTPFLFGSQARYGVFTRFELAIEPLPQTRTLLVVECDSVERIAELHRMWKQSDPRPTALFFSTRTATRALVQGNDNFVSDQAVALLAVEWNEEMTMSKPLALPHTISSDESRINRMWQNILRLPRTLSRLFPQYSSARFSLPAEALSDFDERVDELGRDRSLDVAVWGTLDAGHVVVRVLHPDDEARTVRRAAELLERLAEDALHLGGVALETAEGRVNLSPYRDALSQSWEVTLLEKCDPSSLFKPHKPSAN